MSSIVTRVVILMDCRGWFDEGYAAMERVT